MKTTAVFLLIAAAPVVAHTPWALQSPTPTYWSLRGVSVLSPERAFVAGRDKVLMETTDAGRTWALLDPQYPGEQFDTSLNAIDVLPTGEIRVSGFAGLILASDVPDVTRTPGDLDGNGIVGILDFRALLAAWEPCPPNAPCAGDGDGLTGILDPLILPGNWS